MREVNYLVDQIRFHETQIELLKDRLTKVLEMQTLQEPTKSFVEKHVASCKALKEYVEQVTGRKGE